MKEYKIKVIIKRIFILYCTYVLVTGILLFWFCGTNNEIHIVSKYTEGFLREKVGQDRVLLIEDSYDAGISRIHLIENAEKTLDIAYYTIHKGMSSDIFFGKIIEAADRGVQVRILLDGIFHNLRGSSKGIQYALAKHPNIELKLYESFDLFRPWTWNNRLHDKYIIVDKDFAMIGGRNIGDKYLLQNYQGEMVRDRDVVIVNTDTNNISGTVLKDIKTYFDLVWNHEFSQYPIKSLKNHQLERGKEKEIYLIEVIEKLNDSYPEVTNYTINWKEESVPTNKITLIHNPIMRLNKEPWILNEINRLMLHAEESIFIQSPYIIPTKEMKKYISIEDIGSREISILTNSVASSPNYLAIAGYLNNRKSIVDFGTSLYEYQGEGSIHGKSFIIDNRISAIGTFNVDARSSFLNTESMVVIDSPEFVQLLQKANDDLLGKSLLVEEDYNYEKNPIIEERKISKTKGIITSMLRIVTYFIDFLL